jgi:CubicO group peptidase (beta-lactamase class C family)
MTRSTTLSFLLFILILSCTSSPRQPTGSYFGLLKFPSITYHIYLDWQQPKPVVINTTFKASEFALDTIYFHDDSLHFRLKEFYSEYKGHFNKETNRIIGQWIDEDSTAHPLEFVAANPDTVAGLRPRTSKNYTYQPPNQEKDEITVCAIVDQDMTMAPIDTVMQRIISGHYPDVHSLLVSRNNCLLVEEYFYRYDRDYVYNIQSATKSVVSALTGIALEKGEIRSIDETLCSHLPRYEKFVCNEQNKNITLRQLLTMSTGLAWDEQTYDYMDERNSLAIAANERDQFVHLFSKPLVKSNAPVFAYNSLNHLLINAVLLNATHLANKEELTERLLKPLGIEKSNISDPTPMGVIGDIGLRPRDMLKFGLLYLNKGKWKGEQIVSANWIEESTTPKIKPRPSLGYGYFWWTRDFDWNGKKVSSYFAWGYGGQYIFVIPEVQLVIVMSGSKWGTDPEDQAMEMVEEIISSIR